MFIQTDTENKSFLDIYNQLKEEGIKKNAGFFLKIIDCSLSEIDPYDPNLSDHLQDKILDECKRNFYYFLREVIRIPDMGGGCKRYELNKAILAMNFCMDNNLNIIAEISRFHGSNITVICRTIWETLFIENFNTSFTGTKLDNSKLQLSRAREIISALPYWMKLKLFKKKQYYKNNDRIITCTNTTSLISAISPSTILNLNHDIIKGHQDFNYQRQWYNDMVYIKDIRKLLLINQPKFQKVKMNAKKDNIPHGIICTTTSGDTRIEKEKEVYNYINCSVSFSEKLYDLTSEELNKHIMQHSCNNFIHIKYNYKQLGKSEEWLKQIYREMNGDNEAIRKEILVKWL